jgi:predicted aldo/keto reductase-like oxidoreductase
MSQYNFVKIYKTTVEHAEKLIKSESHDDIMKSFESYSSSFRQLTKILEGLEDKESVRDEIDFMTELHEKVENKLKNRKSEITDNIRKILCREKMRSKYEPTSIKSSLVNKKM